MVARPTKARADRTSSNEGTEGVTFTNREDIDLRREFSSWKFDMIDAFSMDVTLPIAWRLTGVRLIQYTNQTTRSCYPSVQAIADDLGLGKRGVSKIIRGLQDRAWIEIVGKSQWRTNIYRVLDTHRNAILDRQTTLSDSRREARERHPRSPIACK